MMVIAIYPRVSHGCNLLAHVPVKKKEKKREKSSAYADYSDNNNNSNILL